MAAVFLAALLFAALFFAGFFVATGSDPATRASPWTLRGACCRSRGSGAGAFAFVLGADERFEIRGAMVSTVSRALPRTCSTVSWVLLTDSLSVCFTFEILDVLLATTSSV